MADITITASDLGAHEYGSARVDLLTQTRIEDIDLPSKVVVAFANKDIDYQQGAEEASRIIASHTNIENIALPIAMDQSKAIEIADVILSSSWSERKLYNFSLPFKYVRLNPTNTIELTHNGTVHTFIAIKVDVYPPSHIKVEAVSYDAENYSTNLPGGSPTASQQSISLVGPTLFELMDIPMLRDADDSAGFYIAGAGYYAGWSGSVLYRSTDSGDTYNSIIALTAAATIGTTTDVLADANPWQWDRTNTVNVRLVNGTFSSTSEINTLNNANAVLIGSEIVLFQTATLEADGTYTLSDLIRARRGTEWATSIHAVGERVVLLNATTLIRYQHDNSNIDASYQYKMVSNGTFLQNTASSSFTSTGVALTPYSPVNIKGSRDGSNNLTVTWNRRSRITVQALWNPTLGESTESYELEFWNVGETVQYGTTKTATSETYSYTAAAQTADGATPGQSFVVKIYQISAVVGRGYEGKATI